MKIKEMTIRFTDDILTAATTTKMWKSILKVQGKIIKHLKSHIH